MFVLIAVFLVVLIAGRVLEKLSWTEIAVWVLALAALYVFCRPGPDNWLPFTIGIGVLDIVLLFRIGSDKTGEGRDLPGKF